ncbi:ubiquitin-conjugating enzyme/RWD-like protein [Stachybotrys elegans]|uniref:Ubiquitin-conjugating enzyme/RWD-like protein n=1 Tax=Stachybotrys elegans TaxID=80388 RepID=A0A8K0WW15_9HYPO|nr:ubiquitin-conjugating enzyme/RWD-like protein [Stachybotrys elegans]
MDRRHQQFSTKSVIFDCLYYPKNPQDPAMDMLPSLRRQHLLSEFSGLKQACPKGIFVSLTPEDPTLWSAVLFIRQGPYAPAVLRFQISFPSSYPNLPPLVTFATDMFHPLITPLTTYMYSTDVQDNGTVSATDEERLPPGGFSLRHGFPEWFGRGKRTASGSRQVSGNQAGPTTDGAASSQKGSLGIPESAGNASVPSYLRTDKKTISTYEVLKYIKSTFDSEEVLNSVPLDAAGNPGAWHAWRTHQRKLGKLPEERPADDMSESEAGSEIPKATPPAAVARRPVEWNWEGVWEDRVKKGIAASLSEPVLYGTTGVPDELIRFLSMEEMDIEVIKENIQRTLQLSS